MPARPLRTLRDISFSSGGGCPEPCSDRDFDKIQSGPNTAEIIEHTAEFNWFGN